jgi:hypothetical protein
MKTFSKFAAVAAILAVSSCVKDVKSESGDESSSVRIQVTYPVNTETRAEGTPVANGEKLEVRAGHIFFLDKGTIIKHVGIGNEAGSYQVSLTDLKSGEAVISGVTTSATECYIISNLATGIDLSGDLEGKSLADELNKIDVMAGDINNSNGDVSTVPMHGQGNVDALDANPTTTTGKKYQAKVSLTLQTIASRLQIGKIVGVTDIQGTAINSFTMSGIYLNVIDTRIVGWGDNYLGTNGGRRTLLENKKSVSDYTPSAYGQKNAACLMEDLSTKPAVTGPGGSLSPSPGKVWAYNLFCPRVPHIVIHFAEVKYQKGSFPEVTLTNQYITIRNFKYSKDSNGHYMGDPVTEFKPDNVYTIDEIVFNRSHLSSIPEQEAVDVFVSVTPVTWADNEIEWSE